MLHTLSRSLRENKGPALVTVLLSALEVVFEIVIPLFMSNPEMLPEHWRPEAFAAADTERARIVLDYVAGMTDRYAMAEWDRLCAGR